MTPLQTIRLHGKAVHRLASVLSAASGGLADREDLEQEGFLALLEMRVESEAPDRQRHGYVEQRVRGAMQDSLRRADPCTRQARRTLRAIAAAEARLSTQTERRPTHTEIASEAGLSLEAYFAARHAAHVTTPLPPSDEGAEDRQTIDAVFLAQHATSALDDPLDVLMSQDLQRRFVAAIDALPARFRHVMVERLVHKRSLKDIASDLGVTESRVCQMQKKAAERLRAVLISVPSLLPRR
ncbi:sigma-70 family RNA polymerase sigma factor [Paraburkholderia caribensis]|uniref:sigma-70 family RNA polymerase sigma factor n=1 Tax=Paraburkholderia caribensis TaxID=75105 RepID=UPI002866BD3A|nr:sigma-70 family RNA polymerase sigma factor [Paraburkholderia caribensis]MDR6381814.1 RNA polymerase sigma factor for flagellar operon FliA [Paraburkholderia caribensis]